MSNNGVLSHPKHKEMFPDVLMELSVFLFVSTASDSISGNHWEVPDSVFIPFFQVFLHSDEIPAEPSLLQAEQSVAALKLSSQESCPRPLIISMVFHWAHQYAHVSLVLGHTECLDILKFCNNLFW